MIFVKLPTTIEEVYHEFIKFIDSYQNSHPAREEGKSLTPAKNELEQKISEVAIPKTTLEAYDLLTNYYARLYFYQECICDFLNKYSSFHATAVKTEIERLELFINNARKIPYYKTIEAKYLTNNNILKVVFVRFENKYYKHLRLSSYPILGVKTPHAEVYGN